VALTDTEVVSVSEVLRRVFSRRVLDDHTLDDLVQETLTRILRARPGLEGEELVAYAIVVARNVLYSEARRRRPPESSTEVARGADDPEAMALIADERAALREALAALPDEDRQALMAHEVEGRSTAELAAGRGSSAGAVAARLARARARARVDYVVALRGVSLPTERCRPVLVSLSAGDQRRQRELGAADHLLSCETCAALAPPVVERRRSLAALIPIGGLAAALGRARRFVGEHTAATGVAVAVAGAAAAVAVAGWMASDTPASRPSAEVPSATTAAAAPPAPAPPECQVFDSVGAPIPIGDGVASIASGTPVTLRGATVGSVPADEGFWTDCAGMPVWVQLATIGESPPQLTPGQRIDAAGSVTAHPAGFAASVGVTPEEDGARLDAAGAHLDVPLEALVIHG
jgi:RNA polymerase sigma factor (sigma-70 family)